MYSAITWFLSTETVLLSQMYLQVLLLAGDLVHVVFWLDNQHVWHSTAVRDLRCLHEANVCVYTAMTDAS